MGELPPKPEGETVTDDGEDAAWAWLESRWLNVEAGHDPNDRDYGADDMVDAFIAGRESLAASPKPTTVEASGMVEQAIADVAAERRRQVEQLGWAPDHDDEHDRDLALPRAAACYALAGTGGNGPFWISPLQVPQQVWPYRWEWKPKDRRSNLVRAAALLIAEIERVDRASLSASSPSSEQVARP